MGKISPFLLTFLLNACWQIGLIAGVAVFCSRLLRAAAPRYRHILWVAALGLSFCLPVMTAGRSSGGGVSAAPIQSRAQAGPQTDGPIPFAAQQMAELNQTIAIDQSPSSTPTNIPTKRIQGSSICINRSMAIAIILFYAVFLAYRFIRFIGAWRATRLIIRSAQPIELTQNLRTIIGRCQTALGVSGAQILASPSLAVPVTVGFIRPLIILPSSLLLEGDADVLTSAIGHELGHLLRRDYLFNLIYELIYLPLSFHPAAALVRRRINQTRELGCDELVTRKILAPEVYARSLVQLAGSAMRLGRPTTTITVGIDDADILEERVMTMLNRPKIGIRGRNLLLITAAILLAAPCFAAATFTLNIGVKAQDGAAQAKTEAEKKEQQRLAELKDAQANEAARLKAETEATAQQEQLAKAEKEVALILAQKAAQDSHAQNRQELIDRLTEQRDRVQAATDSLTESQARREELLQDQAGQEAKQSEDQAKAARAKEEEIRAKTDQLRVQLERMQAERFLSMTPEEREAMVKQRRAAEAKAQAELAKQAKVHMEQAIQIATSHQPGTVLQCTLSRERGEVVYILTIVSSDEANPTTSRLMVSGIDGRIMDLGRKE